MQKNKVLFHRHLRHYRHILDQNMTHMTNMTQEKQIIFSGMIRHNPPYLEKYTGRKSRHECPACHDKHSFTWYLNGDTGEVIHPNVGRCNHESGCGYHYTPKQYYQDNPQLSEFSNTIKEGEVTARVKQNHPKFTQRVEEKEPGRIPKQYIIQSLGYNSNFVAFLCLIFDRYTLESPTIRRVMADYYLGCTKNGSIIYWQIDERNRIRTGKVMQYDPVTGKRVKNANGAIDWAHAKLKRDKVLPDDFNLVQCLFGEHLLKRYPDKVVALVESEKSALIAAGVYPEYLWVATGGRSQLSIDKLRVLMGRTVIMFPDTDTDGKTYSLWADKAKELATIGCTVTISNLLETVATDEDRINGLDIADYLIRQLKASIPEPNNIPATESAKAPIRPLNREEQALQHLGNLNPNIYTLIDSLGLVSVMTGERLRTIIN